MSTSRLSGTFDLFSFNKPEVMTEVAALEIVRDHSLYYKVRLVPMMMLIMNMIMNIEHDDMEIVKDHSLYYKV